MGELQIGVQARGVEGTRLSDTHSTNRLSHRIAYRNRIRSHKRQVRYGGLCGYRRGKWACINRRWMLAFNQVVKAGAEKQI